MMSSSTYTTASDHTQHTICGSPLSAYVLSVSLMLMCTFTTTAHAWTPLGAVWPNLPVPYEINASSSQELGAQTSVSVIQAGYDAWINPSCSGFRVQYRGTTTNNWRSGDGVNTHQWIYNSNQRPAELGGRETIGVTLSLYRGNNLIDGDILYNGIDHRWSTNASRFGEVDAQSIVTHEVGHQLGLGHTNVNGATMYPSYAGGTGARSLAQDDLEGVCALYPSSNNVECTRAADCGEGLECVQGQCVQVSSDEGQIGDDCSTSACVDELVCVQADADETFCTRICNDNQCPAGWSCYAVNSSQGQVNICLPDNDAGGGGFGDSCESGQECSSGLCVSNGQEAFCSQSCTQDADCPGSATCAGLQNGGGACILGSEPETENGFGDQCTESSDCPSNLCLDDGESVYCTTECSDDDDCPDGAGCFNAGDINVCAWYSGDEEPEMPSDEGSIEYGEYCAAPSECIGGLCLSDGDTQFCSQYCSDTSDCPEGDECVGVGNGQGGCLPGSNAAPDPEEPEQNAGETSPSAGSTPPMGGSESSGGENVFDDDEEPSVQDLNGDDEEIEGDREISGLATSCQSDPRHGTPFGLIILALLITLRRASRDESQSEA